MINVYRIKASNKRAQQITNWLKSNQLEYREIGINDLTASIIRQILSLSENGFEEIIVPKEKLGKKNLKNFESLRLTELSTEELIEGLLKFPELIKNPITFDEKRLFIGYNSDDIRQFLPQINRGIQRMKLYENFEVTHEGNFEIDYDVFSDEFDQQGKIQKNKSFLEISKAQNRIFLKFALFSYKRKKQPLKFTQIC